MTTQQTKEQKSAEKLFATKTNKVRENVRRQHQNRTSAFETLI